MSAESRHGVRSSLCESLSVLPLEANSLKQMLCITDALASIERLFISCQVANECQVRKRVEHLRC